MKTIIPCLLLAVFAAWTVQGEVIVYKKSQKSRLVGQGHDLKVSSTGYLVLNAATLNGYTITIYNIRGDKFFTVTRFEEGLRLYNVAGTFPRTHTVWVGSAITNKVSEFHDAIEFGIGADAELAITPTSSVHLPRSFTGTFGGIVIPNGEPAFVQNGTGAASYSQKETRLANSLGEAPTDSLARYRALLLTGGYREITP